MELLFGLKKKGHFDTGYSMDEPCNKDHNIPATAQSQRAAVTSVSWPAGPVLQGIPNTKQE